MEGASQLRSVREIWGCLPEYWQTGKPRLEDDVAAVCEGLLAGGASELVVLDNHGGNAVNVSAESLPAGVRLETWRDFDLLDHEGDATFQVGYHARGGVDGCLSKPTFRDYGCGLGASSSRKVTRARGHQAFRCWASPATICTARRSARCPRLPSSSRRPRSAAAA